VHVVDGYGRLSREGSDCDNCPRGELLTRVEVKVQAIKANRDPIPGLSLRGFSAASQSFSTSFARGLNVKNKKS
jgi:hypothetical protein